MRDKMLRRSSVGDLVASQVIGTLASVAVTFLTAHFLGPSGRGHLAFVVAGGNLVGLAAFGSIHVGVSNAFKAGDHTALRRGLHFALLMSGGLLFLAVVLGAAPWLQGRGSSLLLAGIGASFVTLNLSVLRIRQGTGENRIFRNAWTIQSLIYLGLGVASAAVWHSADLVVVSWFVAILASTGYALRRYGGRAPAVQRTSGRLPLLSVSLAGHAGLVGTQVLYRSDILLLGLLATTREVGVYSVAAPSAELLWVLAEALSMFAFSRGRPASTDALRVERNKLVLWNLALGTIAAFGVAIGVTLLLPLLFPAFTDAVLLVYILLPGILVQGCSRIILSSILATGARRAPTLIGAGSIALALVYVPFIWIWGMVGAAAASSIIYGAQTGIVFLVARNHERKLMGQM